MSSSRFAHGRTSSITSTAIAPALVEEIVTAPDYLPLGEALDRCQSALIAQEHTIVSFPEIDWSRAKLSMKEQVDLRRFLRAKEHFLANQDRVFDLWVTALCNVFGGIIADLPAIPDDDNPTLTVPLLSLLPDPGVVVDKIIGTLCDGAPRRCGSLYRIPDAIVREPVPRLQS